MKKNFKAFLAGVTVVGLLATTGCVSLLNRPSESDYEAKAEEASSAVSDFFSEAVTVEGSAYLSNMTWDLSIRVYLPEDYAFTADDLDNVYLAIYVTDVSMFDGLNLSFKVDSSDMSTANDFNEDLVNLAAEKLGADYIQAYRGDSSFWMSGGTLDWLYGGTGVEEGAQEFHSQSVGYVLPANSEAYVTWSVSPYVEPQDPGAVRYISIFLPEGTEVSAQLVEDILRTGWNMGNFTRIAVRINVGSEANPDLTYIEEELSEKYDFRTSSVERGEFEALWDDLNSLYS